MNLKEFVKINWYYLKNKINWNWDRYKDWTPSVTSILKLIWDSWFDFVLNKYKDKVEEAAAKWTLVHDTAESYFKWEVSDIKLNPNISKFHSLFVNRVINMEQRYETLWFSWKIDLEAEVNIRWKIYEANCDYKNAKKKSEKYKLQLWWYELLNWKPWILVYVWNKLEIIQVESFYKDIFEELRIYFFNLLNNDNNNLQKNQ